MSVTEASFYVTGGTLRSDAPSYVERQADQDLYDGLSRGEFCYVLTSRQMGKSSLMVRTAARLRDEGVQVAILDLTAIGQNLSPEQWYDGLLSRLARQLDREDELEAFWEEHERLGPLQRWMAALEQVVLPRLADGRRGDQGDGETGRPESTIPPLAPSPRRLGRPVASLVIFVDEIDAVRSLPFSADEFFAAIRECYNRRTQEPEYERLTFCLLGVASPADLIQDASATPFNIGRRIELRNFTEAEAAPLARGISDIGFRISDCEALLRRVLYWTGGHPYLTQRLCQAAAETISPNPKSEIRNPKSEDPKSEIRNPKWVDRLCEELFLTRKARETEDNLTFVRNRLLNSETDLVALLDLYRRVWSGKKVADDEVSPLVSALKLSGAVRPGGDGFLQVGNRIYGRVFDGEWVTENMPGIELRRQRRAFWRGVLRTTLVAGAVIAVVSTLAILAASNARRAASNAQRAAAESRRANQMLVRVLEAEGVRRMEEGDPTASLLWFLEAMRRQSDPAREEAQRVRIAALLRECPQPTHVWFLPYSNNTAELSKDGRRLLTASSDPSGHVGEVRVWDAQSEAPVIPSLKFQDWVAATFSPDGRRFVTATASDLPHRACAARVWDTQTGRPLTPPMPHASRVSGARFSSDGRRVLTIRYDREKRTREARVWDARTGKPLGSPLKVVGEIPVMLFFRDGRRVLTASSSYSGDASVARVWDMQTGKPVTPPMKPNGKVFGVAFSKDGRRLATGTGRKDAGEARVWDAQTGSPLTAPMKLSSAYIASLEFSRDGARLLTTGGGPAHVWDTRTGQALAAIGSESESIDYAAFSPDRSRVLTTGEDTAVRLWDAQTGKPLLPTLEHGGHVRLATFSPDGTQVLTAAEDRTVRIWKLAAPRPLVIPGRRGRDIWYARFSPDGRRVLTAFTTVDTRGGEARVWDAQTGQSLTPPMKLTGGAAQFRFSPDGSRVLTATGSLRQSSLGEARVWDAQTGELLTPPMRLAGWPFGAEFSPDGRRVLTGSSDWLKGVSEARVWDAQTGRPVGLPMRPGGWLSHAVFSPDGRRVLTAGDSDPAAIAGNAQLWDAQTGRRLVVMKHKDRVYSAVFSQDGRWVLTASADRTARVWEAQTGRPLTPPMQHVAPVYTADFSPDGRRVVTGCNDGTVWIWDVATGKRLHALANQKGQVAIVAFSKDGRRVVTGGGSRVARVWEAQTGQPLTAPMRGEGDVMSAEFSPDGRRVLTASETYGGRGGARVWEVAPDPRPLDDLLLRAQVLSSHRLDETGDLVPVDAGEFRRAWKRLRAKG